VEGLNLAVVIPSGYLSFYTDMAYGPEFGQFISEEVSAVVHDLFPLSPLREDTFIAGLSMDDGPSSIVHGQAVDMLLQRGGN
jgi:S-formylglutathione hydrolase FrmB